MDFNWKAFYEKEITEMKAELGDQRLELESTLKKIGELRRIAADLREHIRGNEGGILFYEDDLRRLATGEKEAV